jgi:hypothetical protein
MLLRPYYQIFDNHIYDELFCQMTGEDFRADPQGGPQGE